MTVTEFVQQKGADFKPITISHRTDIAHDIGSVVHRQAGAGGDLLDTSKINQERGGGQMSWRCAVA